MRHLPHRFVALWICGAALAGGACAKSSPTGESNQKPALAADAKKADAKPEAKTEAPSAAVAAAPATGAGAAPKADVASAELGKPAPDFTLTDTAGTQVSLASLRGKIVVLEWWNPECPFVQYAHEGGPLKELPKKVAGDDLVWLAVNSGAPGKQGAGLEKSQANRESFGMTYPVLLDESGATGRAYGAQKTPHLFIIDATGTLVYRGAVDNAPQGEVDPERPIPPGAKPGERVDFVSRALAEVRAGNKVSFPDTAAYGCSVKYAS